MMGVFKNRELRKIFGPKAKEESEGWKNCIMTSSVICIFQKLLFL
jgi:hypothetical protein